ncbi:MAG: tetratricopeptide repeat protein [Longimicrobiales bacterium]
MSDVSEVLDRALRMGEELDFPGMIKVLEEGLEDDPENPFILCWLAVAHREMGEVGTSYELFKVVLGLQPEDPHILATAGSAIAHFDDPDAEGALRTASVLAPDMPFARLMYGAYLAREGMVAEGIKELQAAAALDEEDPQIPFELGVAYALNGEYEKAQLAIARGVELDPADSWIRVLLGLVEAEAGDLEEAATDLVSGADQRPEDFEAQLLAALALGATSWEDRAYEMVERARHAGADADGVVLSQVEARIESGPDSCKEYLTSSLGPIALRERLMVRP